MSSRRPFPQLLFTFFVLLISAPLCFGGVKSAVVAKGATAKPAAPAPNRKETTPMQTDYLKLPFTTITGDSTTLSNYHGKVLLVVNTASECGFTPQYAGLEKLYEKFKDSGLVILGFPANNYGGQEPGSNHEIATFCSKNYGVTFPMMSKVSVDGDDKHPLFKYLTEQSALPGPIKWNFSKFLLGRDGTLIARFPSKTEPESDEIVGAIRKLL